MSESVPLITDPRNKLLATLPFVHARERKQCLAAIRQAFDDTTDEQTNVQIMLHLITRNGPTLMMMLANVVRDQFEQHVILTGREVDFRLVGLLHAEGSTTESAGTLSESNCNVKTNYHVNNHRKASVLFRPISADGQNINQSADDLTTGKEESMISSLPNPAVYLKLIDTDALEGESTISSLTNPTMYLGDNHEESALWEHQTGTETQTRTDPVEATTVAVVAVRAAVSGSEKESPSEDFVAENRN